MGIEKGVCVGRVSISLKNDKHGCFLRTFFSSPSRTALALAKSSAVLRVLETDCGENCRLKKATLLHCRSLAYLFTGEKKTDCREKGRSSQRLTINLCTIKLDFGNCPSSASPHIFYENSLIYFKSPEMLSMSKIFKVP